MKRGRRVLTLLLLVLSGVAVAEKGTPAPSFFPSPEKPEKAPPPEKPAEKPKKDAPPKTLTVEEAMEKLDLRARVAQLMLVTLEGEITPNVMDMRYLKEYTPGGVMVRQAGLPHEAQAYVYGVKGAQMLNGLPMLVGCDLYALARADRWMPSQFVELPSLLSLSAARDSGATDRFGKLLAQHLYAMGFDFSLGPSLELAAEIAGARPSIYTFGSSPDFAAETGVALISAMEALGIAVAPTGFPGGGANRKPKEPAVLLTRKEDLPARDALPYAKAIAHGVELMHVGNTLAPTLDPSGAPASVSHDVIQQLLRDEMKFDGLVIAGPLDSQDVTAKYDPAEAAQRALLAGADFLYFVTPLATAARVVDKVVAAVQAGDVPQETVDRAVRRVLAYKIRRAAVPREAVVEKDARKLEGKKALAEEAYAVERKAITLIKNAGGVLPLTKEGSTPVGITGAVGTSELKEHLLKPLKVVAQQPIGSARHLGEIQDFEIDRLTKHSEDLKTAVVMLTDSLRTAGERRLIQGLKKNGAKVVVVMLGHPGNAAELMDADAVILAYCDANTFGETMKAVGDVLLGKPAVGLRHDLGEMAVKAGEARHFNALDVVRAPAGRLPVALGPGLPEGFSVNYGGEDLVKGAEWFFGDGGSAKGMSVDYTYATPGEYRLKLQVRAANDELAEEEYAVRVTP